MTIVATDSTDSLESFSMVIFWYVWSLIVRAIIYYVVYIISKYLVVIIYIIFMTFFYSGETDKVTAVQIGSVFITAFVLVFVKIMFIGTYVVLTIIDTINLLW